METISQTKDRLQSTNDYALFYLRELGFSVFVLRAEPPKDRKKPVTSWEPYQHAHPTQAQIEKWFNENPNYNIAATTGNISNNMIAVDVDGSTAEKRIAEKRLEMSPNLRTAFDNTMMNMTGSGGKHIIFRLKEPTAISQKVIWKNNEAHSQILLQGNDHYVVIPPSQHPNGKLYVWNGKTPELLTAGELKELIRLLAADPKTAEDIQLSQKRSSDNDKNKTALQHPSREEVINDISNVTVAPKETLQELYDLVKPYYTPGERNDLIFNLSGMMRKDGGFTLGDCKAVVTRLCNSGFADEDLEGSLEKVENTYKKPLGDLKGRSGLHEILVSNMDTIDRQRRIQS